MGKTTVRPMAAFWHPCHRGIRESIHIRRGGRASKDGLAACRRVNAMASLFTLTNVNSHFCHVFKAISITIRLRGSRKQIMLLI